ncbi:MAG: PrsW family intramembrane metalloprotease [Patescibacteria group bacterium]
MLFLTLILTLLCACIPSIVWLLFFLREDARPEPKRLILYTFGAGAFVSLFVLVVQYIFQQSVIELGGSIIVLIMGLALVEELFKFIAAYWAIDKDKAFNEPVDAMIYMIVAALGFATVENLFVLGNSFSVINLASFSVVTTTLLLRFIGATLLHSISSALVGFYWAKGKLLQKKKKFIFIGILFATLIHGTFNYLIEYFQDRNLLVYPSIFLLITLFFIFIDFEKLKEIWKNKYPRETI